MSTKTSTTPGPKDGPASPTGAAPETGQATDRGTALRLPVLVDRVAEVTGGKKKAVKEIVEATLSALGAALSKGEELNLPGLGKVRVVKSADKDGRAMMTLKLRGTGQPKAKAAKEALAGAEKAV